MSLLKYDPHLYAAVCAAPQEDMPRLLLADWIDENGDRDVDHAWAEMIRLQIAHARADVCPDCMNGGVLCPDEKLICPHCPAHGRLLRIRGLSATFFDDTGSVVPSRNWELDYTNSFDRIIGDLARDAVSTITNVKVTRGFPSGIDISGPVFMVRAGRLAEAIPLESVRLHGRTPDVYNEWGGTLARDCPCYLGWNWMRYEPTPRGQHFRSFPGPPYLIPRVLWDNAEILRDKMSAESSDDSYRWLSWACVAHARREAFGTLPSPDGELEFWESLRGDAAIYFSLAGTIEERNAIPWNRPSYAFCRDHYFTPT